MLSRLAFLLYLTTLALLPWGGLLRVPRLHEHAQWGDLVFAAAAAAWLASVLGARPLPRPRAVHAFIALYLLWAALSFLLAEPRAAAGGAKLLGMAMLAALFVVTSSVMESPARAALVARTVAVSALLTAVVAIAAVVAAAWGAVTPLVGSCGDLLPGPLLRAQAGFSHPNLLASYCLFASGVVAREDAALAPRLRALVQAAITATILLTTSRAILAFFLAWAVRRATTPRRRLVAKTLAAVLVSAVAGLTLFNVVMNPSRPWQARLSPRPSPRLVEAVTSLETLGAHPFFGSGPGSSPGRRGPLAFDAHFTPLNVAATLGLPALCFLALALAALWRARRRPTDLVSWGTLAGLGLDALGQDVEDFRHVWLALGLADAGREREAG